VYTASISVSTTGTVFPSALLVSAGSLSINGGATLISNPTQTLTYTVSDPTSLNVRYLTGTKWSVWEPVTGASMAKKIVFARGSGMRRVYVQLGVATGAATDPVSVSVLQDTSLPTGTISINGEDTAVEAIGSVTPVTLTMTATDPDTPVISMAYNQTGITPLPGDFVSFEMTVTGFPLDTTILGTKKVYVWFKDLAGNVSKKYSDSIKVVL
jgi:hypothetical protein